MQVSWSLESAIKVSLRMEAAFIRNSFESNCEKGNSSYDLSRIIDGVEGYAGMELGNLDSMRKHSNSYQSLNSNREELMKEDCCPKCNCIGCRSWKPTCSNCIMQNAERNDVKVDNYFSDEEPSLKVSKIWFVHLKFTKLSGKDVWRWSETCIHPAGAMAAVSGIVWRAECIYDKERRLQWMKCG